MHVAEERIEQALPTVTAFGHVSRIGQTDASRPARDICNMESSLWATHALRRIVGFQAAALGPSAN